MVPGNLHHFDRLAQCHPDEQMDEALPRRVTTITNHRVRRKIYGLLDGPDAG